jgi:hypothetical protein
MNKLGDVQHSYEYLDILNREVAFHTTIGMIQEVDMPTEVNIVGKIDLDNY